MYIQSIIQKLFILLVFFREIKCTWYFKEAKVCDPSGMQVLPFTGFKISKQFTLDGLLPPVLSYTSLSHCDHGVKDFEKLTPASIHEGIDWNKPFCIVKPRNKLFTGRTLQSSVERSNQVKRDDEEIDNGDDNFNYGETEVKNQDPPPSNQSVFSKMSISISSKMKGLITGLKHLFIRDVDTSLENATAGGFVQYSGHKANQRMEDVKNISPQDVAGFDADDLRCFKIARRKKYARREQPYYIPYTWVGGLFECQIPIDVRKNSIKQMNMASLISDYDFECQDELAAPIAPLVADDLSVQWIEKRILSLKPSITHFIPYLRTAGPLDLRFSVSETSDMMLDSWASQINVNENYTYTPLDIDLIGKATKVSKNYLDEHLNAYSKEPLINMHNIDKNDENQLNVYQEYFGLVRKFKDLLNTEQKHLSVLASLPNKLSRRHLRGVQNIWDGLAISSPVNVVHQVPAVSKDLVEPDIFETQETKLT